MARVRIGEDGDNIEHDWIFAYQLIGVASDVTPQWSLNCALRWFGTGGGRYVLGGGAKVKADWETVGVLLGATHRF
jgi:opacity protein-like surface antigen